MDKSITSLNDFSQSRGCSTKTYNHSDETLTWRAVIKWAYDIHTMSKLINFHLLYGHLIEWYF